MPAKTTELTKQNSLLVRTIEAAAEIKFPDEDEKRFQDASYRKGLAELPRLEIGHIVRLHECLCGVEFASADARALRLAVMTALGRAQGFTKRASAAPATARK